MSPLVVTSPTALEHILSVTSLDHDVLCPTAAALKYETVITNSQVSRHLFDFDTDSNQLRKFGGLLWTIMISCRFVSTQVHS